MARGLANTTRSAGAAEISALRAALSEQPRSRVSVSRHGGSSSSAGSGAGVVSGDFIGGVSNSQVQSHSMLPPSRSGSHAFVTPERPSAKSRHEAVRAPPRDQGNVSGSSPRVGTPSRAVSGRIGRGHAANGERPAPLAPAPAHRAPIALEPRVEAHGSRPFPATISAGDKDSRLVELLHLVSTRGCGDLDPECAVGVLEDAGWDVPEAFARLVGSPAGQMGSSRGPPAGFANEMSEVDFMRLQQQEWDRSFAAEDITIRRETLLHEERLDRAREAARRRRRPPQDGSPGGVQSPPVAGGFQYAPGGSRRASDDEEYPSDDGSGEESDGSGGRFDAEPVLRGPHELAGAGAVRLTASGEALTEEDEELLGLHALVNALIHTQDEADYQAALRRSSEEAYSGGFSVPPADEVAVAHASSCSVFHAGDAGQCSVCLCDLEVGDSLRTLQCSHRFHMACVDTWLAQSGQCPVCKQRV